MRRYDREYLLWQSTVAIRSDPVGSSGSSEGKWDQESVPDIRNGFIDGYGDFLKDHPCRGAIRSVTVSRILPLMIFLDSFY